MRKHDRTSGGGTVRRMPREGGSGKGKVPKASGRALSDVWEPPRSLCVAYRVEIPGANPVSPNVKSWSRGAAVGAAKARRRLRDIGKLLVTATVLKPDLIRAKRGEARVDITIIRVASRRFDDDNWQAAAKPIRDGIADAFGLRDDVQQLVWMYDQRKGKPKQRVVEVCLVFWPVPDADGAEVGAKDA